MSLRPAQPVIYMVDSQSAALASMRPLLEASGRPVMAVSDPEKFSEDLLGRRKVRDCDALIFDLQGGDPPLYRLLNRVMGGADGPKIVLMVGDDAPLGDWDSFSHSRLHVLKHHSSPRQLLDLLDAEA